MRLLTKLTNIFDHANDVLAVLGSALIIFTMLVISASVFTRYFLHLPTFWWVIDVSEYMLLWIPFLGAAWLLKREGHVKMDVVLNRLEPRVQASLNIITSTLTAIVFLIITYYGVKVTWNYFQTDYFIASLLRTPKWIILTIIPAGSFLLFIQFLRRAYGFLDNWRASPDKEQSPP